MSIDLENIRNQRISGVGGAYQIRTLIYDTNGIDAEYHIAPTIFTVRTLKPATPDTKHETRAFLWSRVSSSKPEIRNPKPGTKIPNPGTSPPARSHA